MLQLWCICDVSAVFSYSNLEEPITWQGKLLGSPLLRYESLSEYTVLFGGCVFAGEAVLRVQECLV